MLPAAPEGHNANGSNGTAWLEVLKQRAGGFASRQAKASHGAQFTHLMSYTPGKTTSDPWLLCFSPGNKPCCRQVVSLMPACCGCSTLQGALLTAASQLMQSPPVRLLRSILSQGQHLCLYAAELRLHQHLPTYPLQLGFLLLFPLLLLVWLKLAGHHHVGWNDERSRLLLGTEALAQRRDQKHAAQCPAAA